MDELKEYMDKHHTAPEVSSIIISGLDNWFNDTAPPNVNSIDPNTSKIHLKKAEREQHQIGWEHFIKGRITKERASFINHEMTTKKVDTKYYNAEKWGTDIISINWKFVLELWKLRNWDTHSDLQVLVEQTAKAKEKLLSEATWIQDQHVKIQGWD